MEPERPDTSPQPPPGGAADVATAPAGAAPAEAGAVPAPARRRGRGTVRDMVLSMAVILALVALVLLLLPRPNAVEQPPVDVRSAAVGAAATLPFDPVVPAGLPQGWKPTSAYSKRSTDDVLAWHVGYLTPAGEYAAVEVAAGATDAWVRAQTSAPQPTAAQRRTVAGVEWRELYREDRDRSTLLREDGGVTTLVTGGAGFEELSALAEAVLAGERIPSRATPAP